jgi:hypothetical protein
VGKTFSNSTDTGLTGTRAPAPVEKTGETGCWDSSGNSISCTGTGQDGEYHKGIAGPTPRFTDNSDGTVTDNLTGLIWLKNANYPNGWETWSDALMFANSLYDGLTGDPGGGDCDLSDGSKVGEWRLPNVKELESLIDFRNVDPALPSGRPFTDVESSDYWSITTSGVYADGACLVDLYWGEVGDIRKDGVAYYFLWPVRGGQQKLR